MKRHILIIGGGLTGLTTAFRLISYGLRISIIDKGPVGDTVLRECHHSPEQKTLPRLPQGSNGFPFVLHRFQEATWSLLQDLGTDSHFRNVTPLPFEFLGPARQTSSFRSFAVPSPFHVLLGVLTFRRLSIQDKWSLINTLEKLWEGAAELPQELDANTTESWLKAMGQSALALREVWNPLCQFFLGDSLSETSAHYFRETIVRCFLSARHHHQTFVSSLEERSLLLNPLQEQLAAKGATFYPLREATQIQYGSEHVVGVKFTDGTTLTADDYVSTLSPRVLVKFLPDRLLTKFAYFCNLSKLSESPALIVHVHLGLTTARPRLLLSSKTFHWMTSRPESRTRGGTTLVSCVSTGDHDLMKQPDHIIIEQALADVEESLFPRTHHETRTPLGTQVVRRPHAFLSLRPSISAFRPLPQSPVSNFYLAGPWIDTGLPDSRESSIVSANMCAQAIVASCRSTGVDNSGHES